MARVARQKGDLVGEKALFPQISGGGAKHSIAPPHFGRGGSAPLPPPLDAPDRYIGVYEI